MARIRTIKPEFPQSESMGRVGREARLCFVLLWTLADDSGRLRGNSRMLASLLYPYDDDAKDLIDGWLAELSSEGCIARYEVQGTSYVQITAWADHQKIDKPTPSKLPEFTGKSRTVANPREDSCWKGREGNGEEGSAEPPSDSPPAPPRPTIPTDPAVVSIPLVDGTEYPITAKQIEEWATCYPAVDVLQELREMRTWSQANPTNRKTVRGVNAFVVRWLGKEQDKGGRVRNNQSTDHGVVV